MTVSEASLKGELVREIKRQLPGAVVMRHEDLLRAGVPDMSVTWRGRTSWWEVKYANPRPRHRGLQTGVCQLLAVHGTCYFIIYSDNGHEICDTIIVHPREVVRSNWPYTGVARTSDHDHSFVAAFIKGKHGYDA